MLIHVGFALSKVDEEEATRRSSSCAAWAREFEDAIEELKGSVIG